MVKKLFFLLLFACPLMLRANDPVSCMDFQQISRISPKACSKGYFTHEEKGLVHKIWSLVKKQKINTLKKMMTQDFRGIGIDGSIDNQAYALSDLSNVHIIDYKIQNLVLTRTKDSIIAIYTLFLLVPLYPTQFVPIPEMSIFKKVHDTWKWKADANMNLYNVQSPP